MGSLFRLRLLGDDADHLQAVAEAALDEIERVERLLSWRDARSEVARINREAAVRRCSSTSNLPRFSRIAKRRKRPPTATSTWPPLHGPNFGTPAGCGSSTALEGSFRFSRPEVRLDFGAYGERICARFAPPQNCGVSAFRKLCSTAGTSSVLALGNDEFGNPWRSDWRNPFAARPKPKQLGRTSSGSCGWPTSPCIVGGKRRRRVAVGRVRRPKSSHRRADRRTRGLCRVAADGRDRRSPLDGLVRDGLGRRGSYTTERSNDLLAAAVLIVRLDPPQDANGSPASRRCLSTAPEFSYETRPTAISPPI